jgi:hypothetical protein
VSIMWHALPNTIMLCRLEHDRPLFARQALVLRARSLRAYTQGLTMVQLYAVVHREAIVDSLLLSMITSILLCSFHFGQCRG